MTHELWRNIPGNIALFVVWNYYPAEPDGYQCRWPKIWRWSQKTQRYVLPDQWHKACDYAVGCVPARYPVPTTTSDAMRVGFSIFRV